MTKRLARIYFTYGKGDGEEVGDSVLIEDTREERENLIMSYAHAHESLEDFLDGKVDYFAADRDGVDWDEPTGYSIVIYDKDGLLTSIRLEYESKVDNVERLFKEDD